MPLLLPTDLRRTRARDLEPGIRPAVLALARRGFRPVMSCAGHRDRRDYWKDVLPGLVVGKPWALLVRPQIGMRALVRRLFLAGFGSLSLHAVFFARDSETAWRRRLLAVTRASWFVLVVFVSRNAAKPRGRVKGRK